MAQITNYELRIADNGEAVVAASAASATRHVFRCWVHSHHIPFTNNGVYDGNAPSTEVIRVNA